MFGGLNIAQLIMSSWVMWILMGLGVAGITFILERGNALRKWKRDDRKFRVQEMDKLKEIIRREGAGEKLKLQILRYKGPLPSMIQDFIVSISSRRKKGMSIPREDVDRSLDNVIEKTRLNMEGRLSILGTLSNISPLVGLLGTVLGIMRSFREIAISGSGGSSVVAMGVAEALATTAVGILIAVPCTIAYNYYLQQMETLCSEAALERIDLWLAEDEFMQTSNTKKER